MSWKSLSIVLLLFLVVFAFGQTADENHVASVKIEGNKRIATETYMYYISVRPGAVYDADSLRNDFRRLWQTGFLDDLKIESEETPQGVNVIFKVVEKPLIKSIQYTGNKKISTDDISTKLKDENLNMRVDQPYDAYQAKRIANAIDKLMVEKGLRFGKTTVKLTPVGDSYTKLTFAIDEGPKVKIGDIEFSGNKVFSDKKLRGAMKDTKEHWMFSWISKHDDFEKEKFQKDMERVQDVYFNHGYINAKIDEPKIDLYESKGMFGGKTKRMKLTIPVEEGNQFRTGDVTFSGNKLFTAAQLQKNLNLKKGTVFNRGALKDSLEEMQKRYGDRGYIYASLGPVFDIVEKNKTANVKIDVEENGQFYVNRIEFTGNNFTRDKVIRRELQVQEGDLLRVSKFRDSIDRIYRLGFFDDLKPNITPVEGKQNLADISIDVKENKRNEIRLGGGYSQYEGVFGSLSFSTKNLFGTGKIFTIDLENGARVENYGIQLMEPYFMDRPLSLGVNLFRSKYDYITWLQQTTGGSVTGGFNIHGDFKGMLTYGYQLVDINFPSGTPGSTIDIISELSLFQTNRRESRLIPSLVRSTINNPMDPSRGTRLVVPVEVVGGWLGGQVNYIRPSVTWTQYLPGLSKKQYLAYNIDTGYATGFGGLELPFYERFFLGGERSIRGYELRTIGEVQNYTDPKTGISQVINAGGNKYFVANLEYVIPIAGPLKAAAFLDYGNAFLNRGIDFTDMRGSTGMEIRFMAPFLSTPFRFIYAVNFNRGELMLLPSSFRPNRTAFRFSVGTTF